MFVDCHSSCTSEAVLNQPINKNEYAIGSYICVGLFVVVVKLANLTSSRMVVIVIAAAHELVRRWG